MAGGGRGCMGVRRCGGLGLGVTPETVGAPARGRGRRGGGLGNGRARGRDCRTGDRRCRGGSGAWNRTRRSGDCSRRRRRSRGGSASGRWRGGPPRRGRRRHRREARSLLAARVEDQNGERARARPSESPTADSVRHRSSPRNSRPMPTPKPQHHTHVMSPRYHSSAGLGATSRRTVAGGARSWIPRWPAPHEEARGRGRSAGGRARCAGARDRRVRNLSASGRIRYPCAGASAAISMGATRSRRPTRVQRFLPRSEGPIRRKWSGHASRAAAHEH